MCGTSGELGVSFPKFCFVTRGLAKFQLDPNCKTGLKLKRIKIISPLKSKMMKFLNPRKVCIDWENDFFFFFSHNYKVTTFELNGEKSEVNWNNLKKNHDNRFNYMKKQRLWFRLHSDELHIFYQCVPRYILGSSKPSVVLACQWMQLRLVEGTYICLFEQILDVVVRYMTVFFFTSLNFVVASVSQPNNPFN